MELFALLALLAGVALVLSLRRDRQRKELARQQEIAGLTGVAEEDVTRFGEELQELHIDTLATELDTGMRQDYQRALDAYEHAKLLLRDATTPEDVSEVTHTLEDGRYAQACMLARQAGEPLPQRRPPCFFNPAHGPARTDASWAPAGGIPREVPVCLADAERVNAGAEPDARRVRSGNRMVPWYQGGPQYGAYANGYYGSYAMNGLFPGFLLGSMMTGWWGPSAMGGEDWSGGEAAGDAGGGDWGGGDAGGGDWGSGGGDVGGGWDFGGF